MVYGCCMKLNQNWTISLETPVIALMHGTAADKAVERIQMGAETTKTSNSNANCQASAQNTASIFSAKSLKGNHISTDTGQGDNLKS